MPRFIIEREIEGASDLTQDRARRDRPDLQRGRRLARRALHLGHQLRRRRQDLLPARGGGRRDDPRARPPRRLPRRPGLGRRQRVRPAHRRAGRRREQCRLGSRAGRPTRTLGARRRRPTVLRGPARAGPRARAPRRVLAAAAGGEGAGVAVAGDSGAGKSALVDAACAARRDLRVLRGAATRCATPRPLGPFRDLAGRSASSGCSAATDVLLSEVCERAVRRAAPPSRPCWSSRTCTGSTRRRSTCCASSPAGSSRCRWRCCVTYRDHEIGPRHSARAAARRLRRASTA